MRKKYVVVGTGGRSVMYIDALAGRHRETASLAALCDLSQVRMDYYNQRIGKKFSHPPVPTYKAADFDFRLKPGSAAVDRGIALPTVSEDFAGRAPDLGALEVGKPAPHYGPRP